MIPLKVRTTSPNTRSPVTQTRDRVDKEVGVESQAETDQEHLPLLPSTK